MIPLQKQKNGNSSTLFDGTHPRREYYKKMEAAFSLW